jgi:hypothetical protein
MGRFESADRAEEGETGGADVGADSALDAGVEAVVVGEVVIVLLGSFQ